MRFNSPPSRADLSSSIDLCLPRILSLTKHGRRHKLVSVLSADKICCLQEDGSTVVPGDGLPPCAGGKGTLDGGGDGSLISFVIFTEVPSVVSWKRLFGELAGLDLVGGTTNITDHITAKALQQDIPACH
jgi:hypothetical protein